MITKTIDLTLTQDDYSVLDFNDLEKTASFHGIAEEDMDPKFLYVKVRAVSAGEFWGPNKNADYFPEAELIEGAVTFYDAHVFKNHENKDVAKAIGDVVKSEYNKDMHTVELILRISRAIAPEICRGFEDGFMTDVSMGCKVNHSICSVCGNKAKVKSEFCTHVLTERNKIYPDGRRVYEINITPKFHDISAVLNGAERAAKAIDIFVPKAASATAFPFGTLKVAHEKSFNDGLEKVASELGIGEEKTAGAIFDGFEDANDRMKKEAFMHKLSEIEKAVSGKVIDVARDNLESKSLGIISRNADTLRGMYRLNMDEPWSSGDLSSIANSIKGASVKAGVAPGTAFEEFLGGTISKGIELTPLEFRTILSGISPIPRHRGPKIFSPPKQVDDMCALIDHKFSEQPRVPSIKDVLFAASKPAILSKMTSFDNIASMCPPIKSVGPVTAGVISRTVIDVLPRRKTIHARGLLDMKSDNRSHYYGGGFGKSDNFADFIADILYALYQRMRMDARYGESDDIFKTAGLKSEAVVLPAVLAYSNYQRARMAEGHNVGAFNRFMADSPMGAYMGTVAGRGAIKAVGKKVKPFASAVKEVMQKNASLNVDNIKENTDIFKSSGIDIFLREGYNTLNNDDIRNVKLATTAYLFGVEDLSDEITKVAGLPEGCVKALSGQLVKEAEKIIIEQTCTPTTDSLLKHASLQDIEACPELMIHLAQALVNG